MTDLLPTPALASDVPLAQSDVAFEPADHASSTASCPVCQFPSFHRLERDGNQVVECVNCRFLFVDPMPSPEQIEAYYAQTYRGATADFYPKSRSRNWRAFWRSLAFLPYIRNRDVVDLGCGGGHMLAALSRFARSGTGVDLSRNSIAYARNRFPGQTFFAEDLLSFARRKRRFDFVFSSELLEHLRTPDEFMITIRTITRPGAVVYLSAPDAGHRATPLDLASWSDICPPEHLQWFNETNLAMLFDQHGFVPIRRDRTKTPAHSAFFRRVE